MKNYLLDLIFRLTIIIIPVIGVVCEEEFGFGAFIAGFVDSILIGYYGEFYNKIN